MIENGIPAALQLALVHDGEKARQIIRAARSQGKTIGLIPTMGALHAGHLSLLTAARAECEYLAVSVFVNPTQFGPREDFSKYPRTLSSDLEKLGSHGADMVFAPPTDAMYPPGFSTYVQPPAVAEPLEGVCRPDHFRGVCTVVLKLFELLPADFAYFGQKDYQQSLVVRQMVKDLNLPITVRVCPTIREPDGLAMSSRNAYLTPSERVQALAIIRSMRRALEYVEQGERESAVIIGLVEKMLREAGISQIDYIAIADPDTLATAPRIDSPKRLLIAAFVGRTRLIDNCQIG